MERYDIQGIDLVVSNLYPFSSNPSIELIDIGGPAMIRAAAKNHEFVGGAHRPGAVPRRARRARRRRAGSATRPGVRLARDAFAQTAAYDAQILAWFDRREPGLDRAGAPAGDELELPPTIELTLERRQVLRYGENPHQVGVRYATVGERGWWETALQHGGKEMSYLNVYDTEAAWRLAHSLGDQPTAVVIKHANPCGVAVADDITTAYVRAHECDPVSAFGGIVAVNRPVTRRDGRGDRPGVHRGGRRPRLRARGARGAAGSQEPPDPRGASARASRG